MIERFPDSVLITGGCGYIGSQLIMHLVESGVKHVHVLDNLSQGSVGALSRLPAGGQYVFYEDDIMNRDVVRTALTQVQAVVHLAGISPPPLSFLQPERLEQLNHWGTAQLVELSIEAGVSHFVYISSTSVYGPCDDANEHADCRPLGPFAQSVEGAEHAVRAANVRGLPATVLRVGTVYGASPNTRYDEFLNRLVSLAGTARALTVYGDGKQTRPVVHVRDVCRAIGFVLSKSETRHAVFNVAQDNYSIEEVVGVIRKFCPSARVRHTEQDVRTRYSFAVDPSALVNLRFSYEVSLEDGVAELLAHFVGFSQPATTSDFNDGQELG